MRSSSPVGASAEGLLALLGSSATDATWQTCQPPPSLIPGTGRRPSSCRAGDTMAQCFVPKEG